MSLFVGKSEVVGNKLATYSQIMKKKNLYIILANFYEFEIVSRKKKIKQTSEGIIVKISWVAYYKIKTIIKALVQGLANIVA